MIECRNKCCNVCRDFPGFLQAALDRGETDCPLNPPVMNAQPVARKTTSKPQKCRHLPATGEPVPGCRCGNYIVDCAVAGVRWSSRNCRAEKCKEFEAKGEELEAYATDLV